MRVALPLLLAAGLTLAGCNLLSSSSPGGDVPIRLGEPFTLAVGQTGVLAGEGAPLAVQLDAIAEDSRCPSSVVCVWAGRLVATLTVEPGQTAPQTIQRTLPAEETDAPAPADFVLRLLEADPYPVVPGSIPEAAYRLTFQVDAAE